MFLSFKDNDKDNDKDKDNDNDKEKYKDTLFDPVRGKAGAALSCISSSHCLDSFRNIKLIFEPACVQCKVIFMLSKKVTHSKLIN